MATEDTMMNPPLESLMKRTLSKFSLVTLSARRAREGLGTMVPPQVSSTSRKPLSISFEEIAADKILSVPMRAYEEPEADADAALLEVAADAVVESFEATDLPTGEVVADAE